MKAFDAAYSRTAENVGSRVSAEGFDPKIQQLISEYGGTSYEKGLYRIFNAEDAKRWTATIRRFFHLSPKELRHSAEIGKETCLGIGAAFSPHILVSAGYRRHF